MKKTRFLALVLAISIMLVGAGYAYWDQTLTINNTVTAGNLDVKFICRSDVDDWDDGYISGDHSDLVSSSAVIAQGGQSIDFVIGNFYPGAGASLDFLVKNTGSVPAKITNVVGTITQNEALANALNYKFDRIVRKTIFGFSYEDIVPVDANNVSDLATGLTEALKNIVIQPGEILMLTTRNIIVNETEEPNYQILMPSTITGDDFELETTRFNLALNFTQVN